MEDDRRCSRRPGIYRQGAETAAVDALFDAGV
jgi:hypothetical protein